MAALFWTCLLLLSPLIMAVVEADCDQPPKTCRDVPSNGNDHKTVTTADGMTMVCDLQTDDGGWTVIQRRVTGDVDFDLNWLDYKYGFGDYSGDFWYGLDKVSELTTRGRYELMVTFDYDGNSYFARYTTFKVLREEDKFALQIGGYSGDAGDNLSRHNGMAFTTKDEDNDQHTTSNCAVKFKGAWWHRACHQSNLNGIWGSTEYGQGTNWKATTTYYDSATNIEMRMRLLY